LEQRKQLGNRSEQLARYYLEQQGLVLRESNFYCRYGEIDLIMEQGRTIVFVEVRSRSNARCGQPAETVQHGGKREKLRRSANLYLCWHPELAERNCRFDVVSVLWQAGQARLRWLPDAFW